MAIDRRRYNRYPAGGHALFWTSSIAATGDLLNVGRGGILFHSPAELPHAGKIKVCFTLPGYPRVFEIQGKVVHVQRDIQAFMFLEKPPGLKNLLRWLERF